MISVPVLNYLYTITAALFLVFLVRNALLWLYLWQIKEYRFDRLFIHLRETNQGRKILFGWGNVTKIALILAFFATIFWTDFFLLYPFLVFLQYLMNVAQFLHELTNQKVKVPVLTPRIIFIFGFTFILTIVLLIFHLLDRYFWLLLLDRVFPFLIGLFMMIFAIPSDFYKDTVINRAIKKLERHKKLLVIGITGSYGKGSTKEYMYKILSYKFNVLKTHGTFNTPIGIAKTILSGLTPKKEIFVVEMGAYKRGEIADMCRIIKPRIGVLTAVNNQHVSLFGNIENTKQAKYELIANLPKDGLALFNGNNEITEDLYKKAKKKKILYRANYGNENVAADITASKIRSEKYSINFIVSIRNKKLGKFTLNLIGKHNVENVLPGIYLGSALGMSISELKEAVATIRPLPKTMYPFTNGNGATLIDDSYNANPAAVYAALSYMMLFKGKKVLVFQPMIELGKYALSDHKKVAFEIGKTCDALILTNKNFYKAIEEGIVESGGKCKISLFSPRETAAYIERLKKQDVVVFEGKEAAISLQLIDPQSIN